MGGVNINLAGSTGLDQTIDYKAKVAVLAGRRHVGRREHRRHVRCRRSPRDQVGRGGREERRRRADTETALQRVALGRDRQTGGKPPRPARRREIVPPRRNSANSSKPRASKGALPDLEKGGMGRPRSRLSTSKPRPSGRSRNSRRKRVTGMLAMAVIIGKRL